MISEWNMRGNALPLDLLTADPLYAWSTARKLRAAYAGNAFRVFDGTTQTDVGFSNGLVDTAALATLMGSNTGRLSILNDQGTRGNDVSQVTAGNRPRIYNAGVLDSMNGYPAPVFDVARSDMLTRANVAVAGASWTFILVCKRNVSPNTTYHGAFGWGSNPANANNMGMLIQGTRASDWFEGDFGFYANGYTGGNAPRIISRNGVMDAKDDAPVIYSGVLSNGRVTLRRNGVALGIRVATTGVPGVTGTGTLTIGAFISGFFWPGQLPEGYIFDSDIGDAAITAIETSIRTFWNAKPIRTTGIRGIDGQYLNVGQNLQWEYTHPWTCTWAIRGNYLNTAGGGAQIIFTNVGDGLPKYTGFECWHDISGRPRVRIMNDFGGGKAIDVYGNTTAYDGTDKVCSISNDGSGTAAGIKVYIGGVLQASTTALDALGGLSIVNTKDFIVANQIDSNINAYYPCARLYGMQIDNVVRDATWQAAHATLDTFPTPEAGVTELYPDFSTGSGTAVADLSGHARNGVLSSANMWLR